MDDFTQANKKQLLRYASHLGIKIGFLKRIFIRTNTLRYFLISKLRQASPCGTTAYDLYKWFERH